MAILTITVEMDRGYEVSSRWWFEELSGNKNVDGPGMQISVMQKVDLEDALLVVGWTKWAMGLGILDDPGVAYPISWERVDDAPSFLHAGTTFRSALSKTKNFGQKLF